MPSACTISVSLDLGWEEDISLFLMSCFHLGIAEVIMEQLSNVF